MRTSSPSDASSSSPRATVRAPSVAVPMSTRICSTAYSACAASTLPNVSGDIARLPAASHTSCDAWPMTVAAPKIAAERLTDMRGSPAG